MKQPPHGSRPGRVLLAQDRPTSLAHQKEMFEKAASERSGQVEISTFDLRRGPEELVQRCEHRGEWFDWLVADLMEDMVDRDPVDCAGVRLIQELVKRRLFLNYRRAHAVPKPAGVRSIAICSVLVGDAYVWNAKLKGQLQDLGVRFEWFAPGGDILPLARRICEDLENESCLGAAEA